jgi:transcriptional repressor NrdR
MGEVRKGGEPPSESDMKCPFCGHPEDKVVDSRVGRDGEFIRRRRECLKCHRRYTTYEYVEDVLPMVVKRDGRREPFDRQKLRASILRACEKRSVGVQAVDNVVADIEAKLHERSEKEIRSLELGEMVMEQLQKLDQVAYVRFASVYRQFKDISQFMDEVKGLLKNNDEGAKKTSKPQVKTKV